MPTDDREKLQRERDEWLVRKAPRRHRCTVLCSVPRCPADCSLLAFCIDREVERAVAAQRRKEADHADRCP